MTCCTTTIFTAQSAGLYRLTVYNSVNVIGNRQITAQTITHTENGILRTKSIGGPLNTNNNSVSSTVIIALYMDINTNLNFGNTLNNGTSGSYNSYINISKL